jgi:hypothetical protein
VENANQVFSAVVHSEVGSADIIGTCNSDRNRKVGFLGTFYGNPVAQKVQILLTAVEYREEISRVQLTH